MEYRNYLKVKNRIPFLSSFCYIDSEEKVADQIFIDHGMTFVYFHKNELYNKDVNLIIVHCTILSKDTDKFIECMEHLRRKLEFLDYNMEDYDYLSQIFTLITENLGVADYE